MTGGDPISARFMRQDFFEYWPTHKPIMAGNHRPMLRLVDEAIRSRLNLIPFTVTIPEAERDPELSEKLKAEGPEILRWMIEGCLAWRKEGLGAPPAAVREATNDYFHSQDTLSHWIDERTESRTLAFTLTVELFRDWEAWAAARDIEEVGTKTTFTKALQEHGLNYKKTTHGGAFKNLVLKPKREEEDDNG
jgi:putative DNA primase/helicase